MLAHPSLEKLSENPLERWLEIHQSLTYTIVTNGATTSQSRTNAHQLDGPRGNEDAAATSDYKLVVKLSDKGVVARFRGSEPQLILKETNDTIRMDKGILEENLPIVVQGLKPLRSGDFEVHTEKVDHVRILQAATHWVSVFGANARVHINTYGALVHSICPKSPDLGNPSKVAKVADLIFNINRAKLSLFTKPESITYIGWLKSDIIRLKSTSIKVEFDTPELANEVIRKGLNWDGQPHLVERYVTQSKIMQCFNCQSCGHIGNRCPSTTKCAKCADHHDTKSCTATHPSRSNNCKACLQAKERMKKALREAPIYWPLKTVFKPPQQDLGHVQPTPLLLPPPLSTAAPTHNKPTNRLVKEAKVMRTTNSNHILSPRALVTARRTTALKMSNYEQHQKPLEASVPQSSSITN